MEEPGSLAGYGVGRGVGVKGLAQDYGEPGSLAGYGVGRGVGVKGLAQEHGGAGQPSGVGCGGLGQEIHGFGVQGFRGLVGERGHRA